MAGRSPADEKKAALVVAVFLWMATSGFAHRLDESLQATLVEIRPEEICLRINFVSSVSVAAKVLALIDRNGDGVISKDEATTYIGRLKDDLVLRLDERRMELRVTASEFSELRELRTGSGVIQIEFSAVPGALAAGAHTLSLENRHLPALSVYLFNAAKPKAGSIEITTQKRSENQSVGQIEFRLRPSSS